MKKLLTTMAISLLLVSAVSIRAETFTGAISTDWHTGSNWSGGRVPNLTGVNGANITNGRTAAVIRDTAFHGDFDMSNGTASMSTTSVTHACNGNSS